MTCDIATWPEGGRGFPIIYTDPNLWALQALEVTYPDATCIEADMIRATGLDPVTGWPIRMGFVPEGGEVTAWLPFENREAVILNSPLTESHPFEVPEPSSGALLGFGILVLMGLVMSRRRRVQ